MLMTVGEFRSRVSRDMTTLVKDLQDHTGRYGSSEAESWANSLPLAAEAFSAPSFQRLHLFFRDKGRVALEYRLPASSSWCDMVLLGEHDSRPASVIVEMKHWRTKNDKPGSYEGLMERQGRQDPHPSSQVQGYVEYCRRFHSTVREHDARVHGCVLFTLDPYCETYRDPPNDRLVADYPCFTMRPTDISEDLPEYFASRLTAPNENFAREFERGRYTQSRSFCVQIANQIMDPDSSPFELIDNQRHAFNLCLAEIRKTPSFKRRLPRKKVIVIVGPPGSGKSVIAARLWAELVRDQTLPKGSAVLATTSVSQNSNWKGLFTKVAGSRQGEGVVLKANEYIPWTTQDVGRIRKAHQTIKLDDPAHWREHLKTVNALGVGAERIGENGILISIVDEAHALINPEHQDARGQFGFAVAAGPQGYHIIRGSVVSIFLLDPEQGFRERETTSISDLKAWAKELDVEVIKEINLEGVQFRCAGLTEYTEWVDALLAGQATHSLAEDSRRWIAGSQDAAPTTGQVAEPASGWAQSEELSGTARFELEIVQTPADLEEKLRGRVEVGASARLLSSYARPWTTKGASRPHDLPANAMDFDIPYTDSEGTTRHWSKVWNFVPGGTDYTAFIQAKPGYPMESDPLCEVGCPYAVRGFDYDYVGILWMSDLVFRSGRWVVNINHVHESGLRPYVRRAKKEEDPEGEHHLALIRKVGQAYRILLTRAMKGLYLWFEDRETREHVSAALARSENPLRGPSKDSPL